MRIRTAHVAAAAALAFAAASATSAAAADSPFTGFYMGAHGAYNWQNGDFFAYTDNIQQLSNVTVGGDATHTARGLVVVPGTSFTASRQDHRQGRWEWGGQVGYAMEFGNNLVAGIEGDFDGGSGAVLVTQTTTIPATVLESPRTFTTQRGIEQHWGYSVRARLGMKTDKALFYVTAGLAGGLLRASGADTISTAGGNAAAACPNGVGNPNCFLQVATGAYTEINGGRTEDPRTGWTAGVGAEYAVTPKITVGFEYRHTNLGTQVWAMPSSVVQFQQVALGTPSPTSTTPTLNAFQPSSALADTKIAFTSDQLSLRLSYHFK